MSTHPRRDAWQLLGARGGCILSHDEAEIVRDEINKWRREAQRWEAQVHRMQLYTPKGSKR